MLQPLNKFYLDKAYRGEFIPCSMIHQDSCSIATLKKFITVFWMATSMYTPIHMFPVIVFKRKKLFNQPIQVLFHLIYNIIKSCIFIALYVSLFQIFMCFFKNYRRKMDKWNVIYSSFICSFAVLLEPTSRRIEIALFFLPRFL